MTKTFFTHEDFLGLSLNPQLCADRANERMEAILRRGVLLKSVNKSPIFICTEYEANPLGGPAIQKTTYCLTPGQLADPHFLGMEITPKV